MELVLVILAAVSPFVILMLWVNSEDKRRHELLIKELEIERLKALAKKPHMANEQKRR